MDHIRLHVNYVVKLKGIGYVGISAHQTPSRWTPGSTRNQQPLPVMDIVYMLTICSASPVAGREKKKCLLGSIFTVT